MVEHFWGVQKMGVFKILEKLKQLKLKHFLKLKQTHLNEIQVKKN